MDSEQVGEGSWAGNNFRFNLGKWKSPLTLLDFSWKHLKINGWKISSFSILGFCPIFRS